MAKVTVRAKKPTIFKDTIHRCGNVMYVIPRQEDDLLDDPEGYVISFVSEGYSSKKRPEDVAKSIHKFCPYCGQLLYILEEGESNHE